VETAGPQNTDDSARYRLRAPDQSLLPATVVARGRAVRLSPAPPRQPGIHDILRAGPDGDETVGAAVVNVAAEESDTRVLPPSEIARVAGGRAGVLNDEGDVTAAGSDRPLWPRLLFAAAACLFAEMLLLALWRRPTTAALKTEAAT
jgi:hypothetical protein